MCDCGWVFLFFERCFFFETIVESRLGACLFRGQGGSRLRKFDNSIFFKHSIIRNGAIGGLGFSPFQQASPGSRLLPEPGREPAGRAGEAYLSRLAGTKRLLPRRRAQTFPAHPKSMSIPTSRCHLSSSLFLTPVSPCPRDGRTHQWWPFGTRVAWCLRWADDHPHGNVLSVGLSYTTNFRTIETENHFLRIEHGIEMKSILYL